MARLAPALVARPDVALPEAAAAGVGGPWRPTLLYLFQSADCARHAALQRRWAGLGRDGLASVVGVRLDPLEPARADGAPSPGPGFPLRQDLRAGAARLMKRLGYRTTPVTVVLDPRGRPRLVLPPPVDEQSAEAGALAVRAVLAGMGR